MTELAQVLAAITRLEAKVDAIRQEPRPNLTRVDFAKRSGLSINTVKRRISAGLIRVEKGRIPYSELQKFAS